MQHAKLLDCTLRDGAYLIDKEFGDPVIKGIIAGLVKARVDFVEIGFLQNDGFGEGKTVFKNATDAARFVPNNHGSTMFTVLADYSRYDINNLEKNPGNSFDAVRACFFKKERYDVIDFCKKITEKGYKVFVQPVDILGYSDEEIIELLRLVSSVDPYCVSIVDTFGSMYQEDLERVFHLLNHNLPVECKIGFHSHNNMQMSSALSQDFLRMSYGHRDVVVDATLSGMGRGAGNTPTELVAEYMVSKLRYNYDMDAMLDVIDTFMPGIRARCSWGYNTPMFIAGAYSSHVNNIEYLLNKNCVDSKGMRYILNKIGAISRKRYDYDLLEQTYLDYVSTEYDDSKDIEVLKEKMTGKNILVVAPGPSSVTFSNRIEEYRVQTENTVVITVNFIPENMRPDYVFISNVNRFSYWMNSKEFDSIPKIVTSNVGKNSSEDVIVASYPRVIKCGWENMENATILLLRLLDCLEVKTIALAGFDGYEYDQTSHKNYAQTNLELVGAFEHAVTVNREITEMLEDYINTKKSNSPVIFVTPSRFDNI